jgi:hypothetical protein
MKLLTNELRKRLLPLGATQDQENPTAICKFFTPDGAWSWFPFEFDGSDLFFGAVAGIEFELGYFRLSELKETRGPLGLPIERDLYFKPTSLSKIREQYGRRG